MWPCSSKGRLGMIDPSGKFDRRFAHKSVLARSQGKRGGTGLLRVNQIVSIRWRDNHVA